MARKISVFISLLLLLALSGGSFFYYAYLNCSEIALKIAAHASLSEKNNLEIIKLPSKSFNKHNDEVWYYGHLYDIASYTIVHDTAVISVLHDDKEELLATTITDCFSSNRSLCANNTSHISHKHFYNPNDVKCLSQSSGIPQQHYGSIVFTLNDVHLQSNGCEAIESPPPQA